MKPVEASNYSIVFIKRITAIFAIVYLLITYNLYLNDGDLIPFVSAIDGLVLPLIVHLVLYIGLLLSLAYVVFKPLRWEGVLLYLLFYLLAVIFNVNRFVPYYQHFIFFLFLPVNSTKRDIAQFVSFVLGVTYLFSGLHKFSQEYNTLIAPWLYDSFASIIPMSIYKVDIPWYEVILGLLLISHFVGSSRFIAPILMHVIIIASLLFINWNLDDALTSKSYQCHPAR